MKKITQRFHRRGIWLQVLIIIFLALLIAWAGGYSPGKSCTIFTAAQGETVLYGNSEDQHNPDPMIGFFPPSSEGYGSVHFGTRSKDGQINFEGAVNDQGLAWDLNSTPKGKLDSDPNPAKPYIFGDDNFLYRITKKAASVEEAIRIAKSYHFGESLNGQYHIADASGDAVVISAGPDGKVAFTRKDPGEGYLLSTNFNLAQPDKGPVDFRWETAGGMLKTLGSSKSLTPAYAGEILEAVHLETLTSYTLYSNVLDLKENRIYLNYMAQFNETAEIDMEEEFKKGQREVEMREFFSAETATAGDAAYQRFATRFLLAKIGVILIGLILLSGIVYLIIRTYRKHKKTT
ncbi:MAG: hypothetical protein WBB69_16405 [Anaerolineales bacterium]